VNVVNHVMPAVDPAPVREIIKFRCSHAERSRISARVDVMSVDLAPERQSAGSRRAADGQISMVTQRSHPGLKTGRLFPSAGKTATGFIVRTAESDDPIGVVGLL